MSSWIPNFAGYKCHQTPFKVNSVTKGKNSKINLGDELAQQLLKEHGPLMSGEVLWRTLGFRNAAAFRQAKAQGRLGIPVFSLPNRRGTFAFTRDVADWLRNLAKEVRI